MPYRRAPQPFKLTPPPGPTERQVQRAVLGVFRRFYSEAVTFHIPNGGARDPVTASILKGDGVLAGVYDLCVVRPHGRVTWIEIKNPGGVVSKEQRALADTFADLGHTVYLIMDASDAYTLVQQLKAEDAAPPVR